MIKVWSLFLGMVLLITSPVYADLVNGEPLDEESEDEVVEYTEREIESNFVSRVYQVEGNDGNHYLVEGGNEKAINSLATKEHTAQGTVIESTNVEGKAYDLTLLSDEEKSGKNPLELRQFVSFETKSGKVFHLIIDHSQSVNNVKMLTEVGEQDLLNLIEENADVSLILEENVGQESSPKVVKPSVSSPTSEVNEMFEVPKEEKSNSSLMIILGASVLAGIAGWYYKIYKPKQSAVYDEEIDESEYIDEDDYIEDENMA